MPIRLSGMNSGLDTDAIVKALVTGYSQKKVKYEKAKTKLEWKQDAWKSLNTKVYSLYTNVSSLRFSSAYSVRKTTSSDQTKATVTASNTAVNGTQKLNVLATAQAASLTGGKLDRGTKANSTLAELGYVGGDTSFNVVKKDGTVSGTVRVSSSSTLQDIADQLKEAGLNANFDENNSRFFVSAKESGVENDFELMGTDANATKALISMGLYTKLTGAGGSITDAGKDYKVYADYKGATDAETEANLRDALGRYKTASNTVTSTTTQISNLTAGMSYARAYAATQEFYNTSGTSVNKDKYEAVIANYSSSSGAVVDADGNVYQATSLKDNNGNAIVSRKDADGNSTYLSMAVTYKHGTDIYTKNEEGKYVKQGASEGDADYYYNGDTSDLQEQVKYFSAQEHVSYAINGNELEGTPAITETTDAEGNTTYSFVKDGKTYKCDTKAGQYVNVSDANDKIKIMANYSYEPTATEINNLEKVTDAYDRYKQELIDGGMSKEEVNSALATYQGNLAVVNSFESGATDTGDNSKAEIKAQVHAASDATTLVAGFAEKINDLKITQSEAREVMEENEAVSSLAGIKDPVKLDEAVAKMVGQVNAAAAAIAGDSSVTAEQAATKVAGADAEIKLNGVTYTSTNNSFSINGITINALSVTGDGDDNAISITTSTDVQGIYDKIKDFLTEYNSVINEITKLYTASSAKGYEPLSDEEKEEMSDKEIEKWEQKIKDSLLRSDTTLNGVMTAMTTAMSKAIKIDGKNYSLVNFGIHTLGYLNAAANEQYAYHIDGDEDDANTSGNKDNLMKAISEDPETVMSFFQKLTSDLYDAVGDKMKMTTLSSSYTIYNDKQMKKDYDNYTKLIKEWEAKISAKEDYYYNKFTAMEKAMASLNSTQNSLSGYFK